jgi:hypothetical protein
LWSGGINIGDVPAIPDRQSVGRILSISAQHSWRVLINCQQLITAFGRIMVPAKHGVDSFRKLSATSTQK